MLDAHVRKAMKAVFDAEGGSVFSSTRGPVAEPPDGHNIHRKSRRSIEAGALAAKGRLCTWKFTCNEMGGWVHHGSTSESNRGNLC